MADRQQPALERDPGGSCFTARDTRRRLARDIGLIPRTTLIERPQSNGIAEAFVRTLRRNYVRVSSRPDVRSVLQRPPSWIAHYNTVHPHRTLSYGLPREDIPRSTREATQESRATKIAERRLGQPFMRVIS